MIARKLSRPVFGYGKGRIALSAAFASIYARCLNKACLHTLAKVGDLDPAEAMQRLQTLHSDARTLGDLVRVADKAAKDLDQAAKALSGQDVLDGGRATETALMARAQLEFLERLDPTKDRAAVAETITRLQRAAHAMGESADSAHKRAGEIGKHLAHAVEAALAHPGSDPGALMGRFQCSPITQSQLEKALAEGAPDARLRAICDEAITSRAKAARAEKRSRAAKVVAEIERAAEAAWT